MKLINLLIFQLIYIQNGLKIKALRQAIVSLHGADYWIEIN